MKRLILYAHYDPQARVREYVFHHLRHLRELGEIHFISNSPLDPETQARLRGEVAVLHLKENRGFDFGMWAHALKGVSLEAWDELLLTNSSVIGPFAPLQPIFDRMGARGRDFWGLTSSPLMVPHLQSYFLVFGKTVLSSEAFTRFWSSVLPYRSKDALVLAYEIGLTQYLVDEGFTWEEAFPRQAMKGSWAKNLRAWRFSSGRVRRFVDPTLLYPDLLLECGMPYVKLGLLERNPHRLNLDCILSKVGPLGFDARWIS